MNVYLDNAASTAVDSEVFEAMKPYMLTDYGNPSSAHAYGRKVRAAIEMARKKIAMILNCTPGEIIFTSGGTEANNAIITGAVHTYGIRSVISSAIEHHAVGHTLKMLEERGKIDLYRVQLDEKGDVDYTHLEDLLQRYPNAMVSLMHANNEIGNLTDIVRVADLCNRYESYFHSDTVQSIGHYRHDLKALNVHGLVASAHKFHGPKGVGFMYVNRGKKITPHIYGGSQERGMRAGTENLSGIVGLATAMEIAYRDLDAHTEHINGIKEHMIKKIKKGVPAAVFNGNSGDLENSLYTVLSVGIPTGEEGNMLLFNLDLQGICASGGSACSGGVLTESHVIQALHPRVGSTVKRENLRFSFSKNTRYKEIDYTVGKLVALCRQRRVEAPQDN